MTTFPESHRDLLDTQVGCLATIGRDGLPQLTAVWFLHDEGELRLSLSSARLKTKNLTARPGASLIILDPENPYRYLEVRGNARVEVDEGHVLAGRINAKYGADILAYDGPEDVRMAVTIEPANVYAVNIGG